MEQSAAGVPVARTSQTTTRQQARATTGLVDPADRLRHHARTNVTKRNVAPRNVAPFVFAPRRSLLSRRLDSLYPQGILRIDSRAYGVGVTRAVTMHAVPAMLMVDLSTRMVHVLRARARAGAVPRAHEDR